MNKKLLLIALPTFMVLSGCNMRVHDEPAKTNHPTFEMSEDNLAHEEIFGGEEDTKVLVKRDPYKIALVASSVKIGYQIQFNANDEGTADDTISIRFIAALTDEVTTAYWHRGLAQSNSYEGADVGGGVWKYKFDDGTTHSSTVFYTALNNGGSRIVAGESGEFEDYSCFAIYTLMNIPYETYKNAYLAAYVELTSDNTINSKGIAVKIEEDGTGTASKNVFYFDPDTTGHFIEGTVNGVLRDGSDDSTHALVYAGSSDDGNYYANYPGVTLKTTDSFGAFYFSPSHFQFFGKTSFFGDSSDLLTSSASLAEYNAPKANGTYFLFVQSNIPESGAKENHFQTVLMSGITVFTINTIPEWVGNDDATVFAWTVFSNGAGLWQVTSYKSHDTSLTVAAASNIVKIVLCRFAKGTTTPLWANKYYNQSGDINITEATTYNSAW